MVLSKRQEIFSYLDKFPHTRQVELADRFCEYNENTVKTYYVQWLKTREKKSPPPAKSPSGEEMIVPEDDPNQAIYNTLMISLNSNDENHRLKAADLLMKLLDKTGQLDAKSKREQEVDAKLAKMSALEIIQLATGQTSKLPDMTRNTRSQGDQDAENT